MDTLPEELSELVQRARDEGHNHLDRLRDDFAAKRNRFDGDGEALLTVSREGRLVAIGGLNRDPYDSQPDAGRVRRVYVHLDARRLGIASGLMAAVEARAIANGWRRLNLYTGSAEAAGFYARLGYQVVKGRHKISHTKMLPAAG